VVAPDGGLDEAGTVAVAAAQERQQAVARVAAIAQGHVVGPGGIAAHVPGHSVSNKRAQFLVSHACQWRR
jgi:hypothetical protein